METKPLIVERTYNAPVEKVWDAITDSTKMKSWYFDIDGFKPEVGTKFSFYAECDNVQYLHLCEVTEAEPQKKLTYSWKYADYPGESYVIWELFPEDGKTRLVLTHRGLETFPDHKDFTRNSFTEGWTYFLDTALNDFLEK
jgi:uncharacterized protein YndB with AHSA1/START domain